jgi:hypothetical protein
MSILSIGPGTYFTTWQSGRRSFVLDALIALALLVLIACAMIALIALFGSTEPNMASAAAADGRMLILPP